MRWNALFLLLVSFSCFGQGKNDSIVIMGTAKVEPPEWTSQAYTQEDKIYNRSVWTFADNPALAGLDRKLAFAYRFRAKNLSIGVPNDEGNLELAFMRHEAFIDYGFRGKKKNGESGFTTTTKRSFSTRIIEHRFQPRTEYRYKPIPSSLVLVAVSSSLDWRIGMLLDFQMSMTHVTGLFIRQMR